LDRGVVEELEQLCLRAQRRDVLSTCASFSPVSALQPDAWESKMSLPPNWGPLIALCRQICTLEQQRNDVKHGIESHTMTTKTIFESQGRLRENIKALENMPDSQLMGRYMRDLDREEDELIQARKQLEHLREEESRLSTEIRLQQQNLLTITCELREQDPDLAP